MESEIPLVYSSKGVWLKTEGFVKDQGSDMWQKVWGPKEGIVLYDNGVELTDLLFVNNKFLGDSGSNVQMYIAGLSTSNKIDVSEFSTLCIDVNIETRWCGEFGISMKRLTDSENYSTYVDDYRRVAYKGLDNFSKGRQKIEVDISNAKGEYYIFILGRHGSSLSNYSEYFLTKNADHLYYSGYGSTERAYVYKVWLE